MTPEIALLVRAVLLSLLVLGAERLITRRQTARREARRTVVKLPMALNPVVTFAPSRPLQVGVEQATAQAARPTGHGEVVRLEPRPAFDPEKQAA